MSAGEPSGSKPAESVREQLMRTLGAVRTRLRGPVPEDAGEFEPPQAYSHDSANGNGRVVGGDDAAAVADDAAGHPASVDTNADIAPSDPVDALPDPAAEGQVGPMDPLLAKRRSSRSRSRARRSMMTAATVTAAAPVVDDPTTTDPLVEPAPVAREEPRTSGVKQTRIRAPRVRPALPLLRRRPRVRKVTRIIRKVDAWGVFKISLVFYVILYVILLVAGVLLWNLANTTGTVANVEGFARDLFGLKTFEFDGEKLFRASWVLGAILVVAGTGFNVTMAVLFNLISDLVGGVRVSVLEEEVVLRERPVVPRRPESSPTDDAAPAVPLTMDEDRPVGQPASDPGPSWPVESADGAGHRMENGHGQVDPTGPIFAPPNPDLPPPEVIDADTPSPGTV
jgi:hypothetical protein